MLRDEFDKRCDEIVQITEGVIAKKIDYFRIFRKIAEQKMLGQFKNEAWLRAELAYEIFGHLEDVKIKPEFPNRMFDLYLSFSSGDICISIKEFANSGQSLKSDIDDIESDIKTSKGGKTPALGIATLRLEIIEEVKKKMEELGLPSKLKSFSCVDYELCLLTWRYFPKENEKS